MAKGKKQGSPKNIPPAAAAKSTPKTTSTFDYTAIALTVVLVIIAMIRFRLLGVPIERDEGEYAYVGNLILHGGMPYRDVYNMKLPGAYCMYSIIIALFGNTPTGIHTGLMIVSILTSVLLYISIKKLFSPMIGLVTATVYSLLAVSMPFLGFAAHATHFINLYVALGLFFYAKFNVDRKWFYAFITGLMFGLAFLMKQQAVFLMVFGGLIVIVREVYNKPVQWKSTILNTILYGLGAIVPYLLVVMVMIATGSFSKFWFWTVDYAREYSSTGKGWTEISFLFNFSFRSMFDEYPLVWLLGLFGLVAVWLGKYDRTQKVFVTLFALLSAASVCPGFYFRDHYFIVFIPALGLLTAVALDYLVNLIPLTRTNSIMKALPFMAVLLMGVVAFGKGKDYYFDDDTDLICRQRFSGNPFLEAPVIAKYLDNHTKANDKIAIIGSEPEVLVYANRRSASGYIYMYPLMELQKNNLKMQKEMIAEIEAVKPEYMVFYNIKYSWLKLPESPSALFDWFYKYGPDNYDQVGLIDFSPNGPLSKFYWDEAAKRAPANESFIRVLKRKAPPAN